MVATTLPNLAKSEKAAAFGCATAGVSGASSSSGSSAPIAFSALVPTTSSTLPLPTTLTPQPLPPTSTPAPTSPSLPLPATLAPQPLQPASTPATMDSDLPGEQPDVKEPWRQKVDRYKDYPKCLADVVRIGKAQVVWPTIIWTYSTFFGD